MSIFSSEFFWQFVSLDLPALSATIFCALACALIGNYLVVRNLSLMGDAISHSVLPGIVIAFLLTSSRATFPVFIGAAIAGIASAMCIQFLIRNARVEPGAAMGVVFSIFFALGVLLIEQAAARSIDLDAECLLHGQLESLIWFPKNDLSWLFSLDALAQLPQEVLTAFLAFLAILIFILLLYKELKISSFDPMLATSLGFNAGFLHHILIIVVAVAVVASFRVVGSILVISMLICPPAAARLWTDRFQTQFAISAALAVIATVVGYIYAAFGPHWFGFSNSVNIAGMVATVNGLVVFISVVVSPRYGIVGRIIRKGGLALEVRREDILALLFRWKEEENYPASRLSVVGEFPSPLLTRIALIMASRKGLISSHPSQGSLSLTDSGIETASQLIRSHRLWETFLVKEMNLKSDHVHDTAEKLEHFTESDLQSKVADSFNQPSVDPHGKKIPE